MCLWYLHIKENSVKINSFVVAVITQYSTYYTNVKPGICTEFVKYSPLLCKIVQYCQILSILYNIVQVAISALPFLSYDNFLRNVELLSKTVKYFMVLSSKAWCWPILSSYSLTYVTYYYLILDIRYFPYDIGYLNLDTTCKKITSFHSCSVTRSCSFRNCIFKPLKDVHIDCISPSHCISKPFSLYFFYSSPALLRALH